MEILFNRRLLGGALLALLVTTIACAIVSRPGSAHGTSVWYLIAEISVGLVMIAGWFVTAALAVYEEGVSIGKAASAVTLVAAGVGFAIVYLFAGGSGSASEISPAVRIGMAAVYIALALHAWNLLMDHYRPPSDESSLKLDN